MGVGVGGGVIVGMGVTEGPETTVKVSVHEVDGLGVMGGTGVGVGESRALQANFMTLPPI